MVNGAAVIGDSSRVAANALGNIFYGCRLNGDRRAGNELQDVARKRASARPGAGAGEWAAGRSVLPDRAGGAGASPRGGDHFGNFLSAVRARDRSRLNADIEEGVISTTLVHLANISYRLRRTIEFDPKTLTCPDPEAQTMFTKPYREPFVLPSLA